MRSIFFSLVLAIATVAGPGAFAGEQEPAVDIPEHGLGLLLETPSSPVGNIYSGRNILT